MSQTYRPTEEAAAELEPYDGTDAAERQIRALIGDGRVERALLVVMPDGTECVVRIGWFAGVNIADRSEPRVVAGHLVEQGKYEPVGE